MRGPGALRQSELDGEQRRDRPYGELGASMCARRYRRKWISPSTCTAVTMRLPAKKVAKELEPFRLLWLEEPVPAENIDAMADIRHST